MAPVAAGIGEFSVDLVEQVATELLPRGDSKEIQNLFARVTFQAADLNVANRGLRAEAFDLDVQVREAWFCSWHKSKFE